MNQPHIPVLQDEIVAALIPPGRQVRRVVDGTLGAGGHARALLEAGVEAVLGLDIDPTALALAQENLGLLVERIHIKHRSYVEMVAAAQEIGWESVDGIVLDLGVSSMQLDQAGRGFAFNQDGPLDMRFDQSSSGPTAADIVNHYDDAELTDLFFRYGDDKNSRRIAKMIVEQRPFTFTGELAEAIRQNTPQSRGRGKKQGRTIHPATRIFQALRIVVNEELRSIERVIPQAIQLLRPGGRLAIISFHSLEDRIVKHALKEASTEIVSPPGMVLEEKHAVLRMISRKAIVVSADEIARNPRSRSAKLRIAEKLEQPC